MRDESLDDYLERNNLFLCRQLTDEEIEECYWGDGYPDNPRHPKEFARAILRKAQEK